MARLESLNDAQVRSIARKYFETLSPRSGSFAADVDRPDLWRQEQNIFAEERINELQSQSEFRKYDRIVSRAVEEALQAYRFTPNDLSEARLQDIQNAVVRALIEDARRYQFRLDKPLMDYVPVDQLFETPSNLEPEVASLVIPAPVAKVEEKYGPTCEALVAQYLAAKGKAWVPKTRANRQRKLALFVEHVGAKRRISEITPEDMRNFCLGLSRMRRTHHTGKDNSFLGRQTDDLAARIDSKTVELHINDVKSMFRWAAKHGFCKEPPLAGLAVDLPQKPKGEKTRSPFSQAQLETLFTGPVFVGCRSAARRFTPGSIILRDAHFWLPILGYYSGARLSELVQLHLCDACVEGPIPYIDINEDNARSNAHNHKHVKTQAGLRKIPLHQDLIELGFCDFIRARQKDKRAVASNRLFFEIPYGADSQPGTVFSKWFARAMDKVGLTDSRLVFHSFRHLAEDALRNALQPSYVINRIIGHDDNHVSGQYGHGVSLEVAKAAVNSMALPVRISELLQRN